MIILTEPGLLFEREKLMQVGNYQQNKSAQTSSYKVAVVFNHPQPQLPDALKEMTEKLIAACRFKPDEAIYVNQNEANYPSLNDLTSGLNIKLVLSFGNIRLSRNMTNLAKHRLYQFGEVKIIQTDSHEKLEKNGAEKKELWGVLTAALNLK